MPAWPARSTTSSFAGSTAIPPAPGGWSSIRELVEELFAGEEAWIVGGAVRDEALDRPIVDVDVAVAEPEGAARRYARASGGAPFPLSERHGAWRVALDEGRTVDFTPLTGRIEDDLATRDFSINAIAERAGTGESVDPFNGYGDLAAKRLRAIGESVFRDDPLRLLRGPRLEDELPFNFRLVPETEELIRRDSALVTQPSKERILADLRRNEAVCPHALAGRAAGERLAAGDPPLPSRDRALGARGARVPRRTRVRRGRNPRQGGGAQEAACPWWRARASARARGRQVARGDRRRARCWHDHDEGGCT